VNDTYKNRLALASGLLGFGIPTLFAWTLYTKHIPQNIATWGMVFVLDLLGVVLAYRDGNKKPFLQIGWVFAALCILAAVAFSGNPINWGRVETTSVILCVFAIVLWMIKSARAGLWAYMAAMYISFFPLMKDYWYKPEPSTLWLWLGTIVGCVLAILGAKKQDFTHTFVPWSVIVLEVIMTVLCVR
jgi:hypothetical protein